MLSMNDLSGTSFFYLTGCKAKWNLSVCFKILNSHLKNLILRNTWQHSTNLKCSRLTLINVPKYLKYLGTYSSALGQMWALEEGCGDNKQQLFFKCIINVPFKIVYYLHFYFLSRGIIFCCLYCSDLSTSVQ